MNKTDLLIGLFYLAIIIPSLIIMARNTIITRKWKVMVVSRWDRDKWFYIDGKFPVAWDENDVLADMEIVIKRSEPGYFPGMAFKEED